MFDIHNYTTFITAIMVFQLSPGPGTLAILNATARSGVGAGMGAVFGTLVGDLVYMVAAVSGLAALLAANPALFSAVQWAGIAYLLRFGWNLLRTAGNDAAGTQSAAGTRQAFRQAFAVGLTNPKVIMFFMAFFPLFMTTDTKPVKLVVMMAHVSLICLLYQTCLVLVGDRVARRLSGVRYVRLFAARLTGAALIGFGLKLALSKR